jgi:hypothetical protein
MRGLLVSDSGDGNQRTIKVGANVIRLLSGVNKNFAECLARNAIGARNGSPVAACCESVRRKNASQTVESSLRMRGESGGVAARRQHRAAAGTGHPAPAYERLHHADETGAAFRDRHMEGYGTLRRFQGASKVQVTPAVANNSTCGRAVKLRPMAASKMRLSPIR